MTGRTSGRKRNWDDPSIFRSSGRTVRERVDLALGFDGRSALTAVRALADDDLPWLEERAVRLARNQGHSWAAIARLLGRTRQSLWTKHRIVDTAPMPPPLRPTTLEERSMSWFRTSQAAERRRREFEASAPDDIVPW